ncbi:DUF2254 domain-containing protein [Deinococcus malanensis]
MAVAGSAIGVAGTVFSITIAALSFAAGTMGPRLLDNFTRDRGNQVTLGVFIATFAFSLYSLRVVRGVDEQPFVPHYNVTAALLLALASTAALVYFIFHVTSTINITHVINLLRDDLAVSLDRLTWKEPRTRHQPPPLAFWANAEEIQAPFGGYLQLVDVSAVVQWATEHQVSVRLLVRPGDYIFPNTVIACAVPTLPPDLLRFLAVGRYRTTDQDAEYAVRQLADVAVRALSPGVNDPVTAIDILDRFGDALCRLQGRTWPDGVHYGDDAQLRLVHPVTDFAGLTDGMFHMIRQYGKGSPAVMLRLLEVITAAAGCLHGAVELSELTRHADLAYHDALANTANPADRADLQERYRRFHVVVAR